MINSSNTTQQPSLGKIEAMVWCIVFGLEASVILAFNVITITVFLKYKRLRKHSSILLTNLAINDVLVALIPVVGWMYYIGADSKLWTDRLKTSLPITITYSSIDIAAGVGSITNHGCIAVERFIATLWPFRYKRDKGKLNTYLIISSWVCALVIPTVTKMGFHVLHSVTFAFFVWMPFLLILLLVIFIAYSFLLSRMRNIGRKLYQNAAERRDNMRGNRFTITAFIVTAASFLAWLPFIVMSAINLVTHTNHQVPIVTPVKFLHFFNSLINPIVYWYRIPLFKEAVYALFSNRCRRQRNGFPDNPGNTFISNKHPGLNFAESQI
ncbi:Trace amine-associated receptor 7e [Acropora cervicornis]|uniref:Trace amine-associated receptor 7e n=1 Tax=Acropora cervicornis TaxID=6130 RepID=A0AAD9VBX0_ACRCE|nr:Trace amine-associated receptor 7e [Acropora cervicornis]